MRMQSIMERASFKRGFSAIVSASLAATLALSMTPAAAFANASEDAAQSWSEAIAASEQEGYSAFSSTVEISSNSLKSFPEKYDLRDPNGDGDTSDGVVTPVKQQSPMNTCWAFAATAASETSILSELGSKGNASTFDLSELYLAWFIYSQVPESFAGASQAGEGYQNNSSDPSAILERGGFPYYASTLYSAGVGPVSESVAPYKNAQDLITCDVLEPGETEAQEKNLTQAEIQTLREQGCVVTLLHYAYDAWNPSTATWGLDSSLYGQSEYTLEESYLLPDVEERGSDGSYVGPSEEGVEAVKTQLLAGRAVAIASLVDTATEEKYARYINLDTWSVWANSSIKKSNAGDLHATTIVGWDDTYSKDNFRAIGGDLPAGDGAWLVKNSWGASSNEFPNKFDWGIKDADGNNTGYFWISYYDETIQNLEAFNFDVDSDTSDMKFDYDQYNLMMVSDSTLTNSSDEETSDANAFTASEDRVLSAVTCETAKPNTDVIYEVYLLNSADATPADGELVLTKTAHYDYGGYHRLLLSEDEQIPMREGQRYSVVVTQKCATDGKYYQVASRANNAYYARNNGVVIQKVNEKESWVYSDGEWLDWKSVSEAATLGTTYVIDNFPIKGLSQERDWASVEELDSLAAAIDEAKEALAAAKISEDGNDVSMSDTWMTKAQYEELSAAVADAEAQLERAGDYAESLQKTTPTSEEVAASLAALGFTPQPGTKGDSGEGQGGPGGQQGGANAGSNASGQQTANAKADGDFAATGDNALAAAGAIAFVAVIALVVTIIARRNKRD